MVVVFTTMQNQVYRKGKIVLYSFTWKAVTALSLLLGSGNKFTWRCGIKSHRSWRIRCSRTQGASLCFGPRGWSKILSKPIRSSAYSLNWDGSQYRYLRNGAIIATHELCALQLKKKKKSLPRVLLTINWMNSKENPSKVTFPGSAVIHRIQLTERR